MTFRTLAAGTITSALLLLGVGSTAHAQGCVAVRPMGCATSEYVNPGSSLLETGEWQVSSAYQYFRSFRHFRGDHEEANRVEDNTEVINVNHATDIGIGYGVSNRLALTLNVPLIYYDRSSLYEHYGNSPTANPDHARFHTGSQGLGDMRLTGSYWVFDPMTANQGNFSLGLGIKMPTGDSNVQDTFHKIDSNGQDSTFTKAVDQSIQLGDGGWGFALQSEGYRSMFSKTAVYYNAFYLFNPKSENDVPHSVADQYAARLGLNYAVMPQHGLSASLGGRVEGIPSEDLIGDSEGRRRPGYVVSIEPGLSYRHNALNFSLNVPYALYRNRTQSVSDKERTAETGTFTHCDAAFADYLVNFTVSAQFGSKHDMMGHPDM
jgi:hypothetical protein